MTVATNHPLFPESRRDPGFVPKSRILARVSSLRVVDFRLGPIPVNMSPHFFLARDVVAGLSAVSSMTLYRKYREEQFGFSRVDSVKDCDYFLEKVIMPDFTLPVEIVLTTRGMTVRDGFHRLAIHAAYNRQTIPALVFWL